MLGRHALILDRALAEDFPPGCGCGQAGGGPPLVGRRVVKQSKSDKLDLKMKVVVLDDGSTMRKIINNYLRKNGRKKPARLDENTLPQAIFWLKK